MIKFGYVESFLHPTHALPCGNPSGINDRFKVGRSSCTASGLGPTNAIKQEKRMTTHEQIMAAYESYVAESESFETKNVKAAAARARKALAELGKLSKIRRAEIQERKNSLG